MVTIGLERLTMKNFRFYSVVITFIALLALAGVQSVWAGPNYQTVPNNPDPDFVVGAPAGGFTNFGTFRAGALACPGHSYNIREYPNITIFPASYYSLLQAGVIVTSTSDHCMVVACFPISPAKYPAAQVWLFDYTYSMWTVAPVFLGPDDMLCGYTFGSGTFAPFTP